ncbi:nitrogen fixation protein NifZ [Azospirillum rugosum]|uniref:Nitrogen fixation protein NifZ n=1 Tax=Azospirillum rugosum TaxID=416170 RepID=A0ABS4SNN0_9PROT|nr:nitrogen fixation protein NifZ [Azospirillum rugosum]MBP2294163.1 nitrogen fixation protein NifZ [Azospirillum rugosum]MDQ0527448.1 nitrogen fixation protein NifZ [Azospirillum rugosum]
MRERARDPNEPIELESRPVFEEGQKVRALRDVRNDGTYPGRPMGDFLIRTGDVGYVKSVGTYLQMYYIYAIDFYEKRIIVGMRAKELELVDAHTNDPQ